MKKSILLVLLGLAIPSIALVSEAQATWRDDLEEGANTGANLAEDL